MVFMRFGTSARLSSRLHLRTNLVPPQHGVSSPGITYCSRATRPMRPRSLFRAAASSTTGTSVARTRRMLAHRPSQKQYLQNETLCRLCMPSISPRLIYHPDICKHRKNPTVKGWMECAERVRQRSPEPVVRVRALALLPALGLREHLSLIHLRDLCRRAISRDDPTDE